MFGSSVDSQGQEDLLSFSTNSSKFSYSQSRNAPFPSFNSHQRQGSSNHLRGFGASRSVPKSKLSYSFTPFDYDDEDGEEEAAEDKEPDEKELERGGDTDGMSVDEEDGPLPHSFAPVNGHATGFTRKSIYSNPQTAKRARLDETWAQSLHSSPGRKTPRKKQPSAIPGIARDIASRKNVAVVDEPSGLLLDMEDVLCRMYDQVREKDADDDSLEMTLSEACEELVRLWKQYFGDSGSHSYQNGCLGPAEDAPRVAKASFLSSILLQLHHPPVQRQRSVDRNAYSNRSPFRPFNLPQQLESRAPTPKVLFDWLNQNHSPQPARFDILKRQQPNPTASPAFWNVTLAALLRADFPFVIQILEDADFNYARTAMEEGRKEPGYHGRQLQTIQQCVNKALQVLRACPVVRSDDWNITGMEWTMYRKQVSAALSELEDLAEGPDRDSIAPGPSFQASHFGLSLRSSVSSFSQSARMAESSVPWLIYQHFKALYNIILGDAATILKQSDDWVEATIALTAWWDGEDDSEITVENHARRGAVRKSQTPRSVDKNTEEAYLRRLDYAFTSVTDTLGKDGLQINSMNPSEVGLASVFEGNVEGVLRLLQTWSLPIAAATAEIASFGGWLELSVGSDPMPGLNEDDLMVLSYGQEDGRVRKDDIMINYSEGLFERGQLEGPTSVRDGWELSLEVLSRMDDQELVKKKVNEFLDRVTIESADKMDRLVLLCTELGYNEEGRKISEVSLTQSAVPIVLLKLTHSSDMAIKLPKTLKNMEPRYSATRVLIAPRS